MKTVALIPIRAGSKGIPGKNMKEMCGKPLCYWVIEAALGAKMSIDHVYYSTDYDEERWGIEGDLDMGKLDHVVRPDWLATDTASSDDVLRHFCWSVCEPEDRVVMLQATSPLTTCQDIDEAVREHESMGYSAPGNAVVSVVEAPQRLYWAEHNSCFIAPRYRPDQRPMREKIPPTYTENGAIYVMDAKLIMYGNARCDGFVKPYIMHPDTLTEIDTPEDWDIVEKLLEARLS